jgi:hypothetical protein
LKVIKITPDGMIIPPNVSSIMKSSLEKKQMKENVFVMSNTFNRDLKIGESIEYNVLDMLKKIYPRAYKKEGYYKDWDIYIPEIDEGVEVKSDQKSQHTGNLVIEIEFNGMPSALSTTKSTIWVFYTGKKYIFTTPERIRQTIKNNKLNAVMFTAKGDYSPKKAYLVKQHLIEATSLKIINETP